MSEQQIINVNYDPANPLHRAKWVAAGQPAGVERIELVQNLDPETGEWVSEQPPESLSYLADYEATNLLHWARWQEAGRPEQPWRPTVQQFLVDNAYQDEPPPPFVVTWADYDASNPDHVRRAELNKISDPVESGWQPTLTYHLVRDAYLLQPAPVKELFAATDEQLRADEGKRRELIRSLRAAAFWALVGAGVPANIAYGYGQQFVGKYGRELDAYILGSAPDFHYAMRSAPEPWLKTKADPERTIQQLFLESIPEPSVTPTPPHYISGADRDQLVARIEAATTVAATKAVLRDLIQILCPS